MSVTCSCVPDSFYFVSQAKLAWRDVQNYKNWSFFSVFSRLDSFPQVFGQVKGWLMLEFQKMRRVSHEVAFSIFFILWAKLAGRSVQNYEKWSFYSVVIRLSPFPQVFEQLRSHFFFFSSMGEVWSEECSKLWKMIIFLVFFGCLGLFPQVFGQVNEWSNELNCMKR